MSLILDVAHNPVGKSDIATANVIRFRLHIF